MGETEARSGPSARQLARILVVDDQKNMRKTLSIMLRGAGYDVQVARDGAHAMQLLDGELFDVVVTDLKLGQVDGLDVLRYSREKAPLTEVIVMTAYGTVESAVIAMKMGAHDYIQKPIAVNEFNTRIQSLLNLISAELSSSALFIHLTVNVYDPSPGISSLISSLCAIANDLIS